LQREERERDISKLQYSTEELEVSKERSQGKHEDCYYSGQRECKCKGPEAERWEGA
jgi:hypothetical protein